MIRKISLLIVAFAALISFQVPAQAEEIMMPFVRATDGSGSVAATSAAVSAKLSGAGFEIVGTYAPYPNANIIIVTNDALKANAAKTDFGGYGVAQRVAITDMNGTVQVSYTNPSYMAAAYQMDGDLAGIKSALGGALGDKGEFGPAEGMTAKQLNGYHYMFLMPYFDDPNILGNAKSHTEMVDLVEANLAKGVSGITKVFRIDIPGKEETVFGIAMKNEQDDRDDAWIMNEIDFKDVRSTAHLPVEIVVSGKKAYALSARFRIAINFPDLTMMGDNSFMNIMSSPVSIQRAQTLVAGGTYTGDGKAAD